MSSDLQETTRINLREWYSNSTDYSDGEIFRYIRLGEQRGDVLGVKKWMARLSESKRTDILKLKRQAEKSNAMAAFQSALDALLPYVGLWPAFQIGTFHRLLQMRCPEVYR